MVTIVLNHVIALSELVIKMQRAQTKAATVMKAMHHHFAIRLWTAAVRMEIMK